jgi:hypothetical protein
MDTANMKKDYLMLVALGVAVDAVLVENNRKLNRPLTGSHYDTLVEIVGQPIYVQCLSIHGYFERDLA